MSKWITKGIKKFDKDRAAILIIDMQNGAIMEDGPIRSEGSAEIIPQMKKLIEFGRINKIPVIYSQEVHRPERVDFGRELDTGEESVHFIEGSGEEEIVADLSPAEGDFVIKKRRYDFFYQTDLEILLKGLDRDTLIIGGICTDVCVRSTVLGAQMRDYFVYVLSDCTAGTARHRHDSNLEDMAYLLATVTTSEEIMSALS